MSTLDVDITRLAEIYNMLSKLIFSGLELEDLKLSKLEMLITLGVAATQGITITDLANEIGTSKVQISRSLDSLEKKNYIYRQKNPVNRRIVNIFLTDYGKEMFNLKEEQVKQHVKSELSTLSPEDYQTINYHLEAISKLLKATTDQLEIKNSPPIPNFLGDE